MRPISTSGLATISVAISILLAACGGGGGVGTASETLVPAPQVNLALNDTFSSPSGSLKGTSGTGLWSGYAGGSDSGSADAGGSAGDGEFVKVHVNFPGTLSTTGTLTWTILRSAYGLDGQTGNLTLQPDPSGAGGYKVVGGSSTQSNIYVSSSGQISGSLPLPISSGPDPVFVGMRFIDSTATSFATYQGTYTYANISAKKGTGAAPYIETGVMKILSNGHGRTCPTQSGTILATYSDTCTDGLDIVSSFDSSANNVVRFVQAPTQTTASLAAKAPKIDGISIAKSFSSTSNSSGMFFTSDFVYYNNVVSYVTGGMYATRQDNSIFSSADLATNSTTSYWSLVAQDISTGKGQGFTNYVAFIYSTVNGITGVRRVFYNPYNGTCDAAGVGIYSNIPGATGAISAVISSDTISRIAQIDEDSLLMIGGSNTSWMGIARRTNSSTVAGYFASLDCQPH
jgi:hypothetical protein